jgi:hypothetical protein
VVYLRVALTDAIEEEEARPLAYTPVGAVEGWRDR